MRVFQSTYVGTNDFPQSLPDFLLRQWFTLNERDRRAIRKAFRSRHWIGAALHLGFLGMTGTTLRSLEYVPAAVLRNLGRQFKQPAPDIATLRTLYRRRRTRFEHQRWAIQQWGLRELDSVIEQRLTEHLHSRTNATLSRGRLEQSAREWLYRSYVAIPRRRAITVLVRGVVQSVALQDHRDLRRYMTETTVQGFIKELLSHRPGGAMTHLEWLRRPPRRRSMKTLLELFAKYQWLEERIGRGLPIPISKERQQVYARRLRRRRSAHIAELPRFRQELETMCFAAVCLGTLVDDMLRLLEIRITSIWTWGHKVVADRLIPARVRKKSEILAELRRLVTDKTLSDEAFRTKANTLLLADRGNRTQGGKTHGRRPNIFKSLRTPIPINLGASMGYGFCGRRTFAVLVSGQPSGWWRGRDAGMAHWQDRFLGIGELSPELSIFELEFFQFSAADIAAIRKEFRPKYRIAVALQLGFMRLTGARLNAFNVVPRKLLSLVGEQVGETAPSIASLRTMYGRGNTRRDHQAWVMQWLKIKAHTKRQERMLFAALREASKATESIDRLIATARQWLFDKSLLVPATSTLRDICIRAGSDTESHIYQSICRAVPSDKRRAWETSIFEKRKDGSTHLEWLQAPPKRRSQKNLRGLFQKIEYLTQLGVATIELREIPMERLQIYARQLQHKRPSRFRNLAEITRTLQLVSFLRVTLSEAADAVLQLAGKLTSDIVSDASDKVKSAEVAMLIDYRKILIEIFGLADNEEISAESLQTTLRKMSTHLQKNIHPTRAAAIRARLTDKIPAVRSLLRAITDLPIQGVTTERAIAGLSELKTLYARHASELPVKDRDLAKGWKAHVEDAADRERAMRALEASTLFELRRGLRRGGCWLEYSNAYRSREQMLIPEEQWKAQRRRHISLLRLPENPKEYLASLVVAAKEGMDAVSRGLARGDLTIDKGDVHLPKLEKEYVPPPVAQARDAIDGHIGTIQLPELLLEMDVQTRFSKTLLGRVPRSEHELLLTYGALLGHGTEMNAAKVALMIPSLKPEEISAAMKLLEGQGAIEKANKLIVEFVDRLPVMKVWGDGKSASSDMMSLQASLHLWNARRDPRRKTASMGMYTHVSNQWPIIYHQPIVLGNRQVGAAIEGVVRQATIDLDWLAVDTHGYTDVGMCIARMQTFDLCPQLANLRERRLTIPKGMKIPAVLASVVDATLHVDCIQERWDDLLRISASISNGTVSAVQVLERFGSVAQGDPIYRAAKTMGRLLRTIYLCDYFTKPEFRREIHRVLNRGESVHTLQRAIHSGAIPHDRGRRPEEMHAISGSLALLTNLVIGWTSLQTQAALTALKARGIVFAQDILRHVSPIRYHNINFRGTFGFPFERYLVELLGNDDSRNLKATSG